MKNPELTGQLDGRMGPEHSFEAIKDSITDRMMQAGAEMYLCYGSHVRGGRWDLAADMIKAIYAAMEEEKIRELLGFPAPPEQG